MKMKIRLYVTTRSDPVSDLDDVKTAVELAKWKQDIRKHALERKEYSELDDAIIDDMGRLTIKECYAVIAYPPGRMQEADDEVGEPLLKFLKKNADKLDWELDETGASAVTVAEHAEKTFAQTYMEATGKKGKTADLEKTSPRLDVSHLWDNFTYGLIADKSLGKDEYEVDLEVVSKEP
jgi:hypothetical protein